MSERALFSTNVISWVNQRRSAFDAVFASRPDAKGARDATLVGDEWSTQLAALLEQSLPSLGPIHVSGVISLHRYHEGDAFDWHVVRGQPHGGSVSSKTLVLCIDTDAEGGQLVIERADDRFERFELQPGDLVVFDHDALHRIEPLSSGRRILLRADLLPKAE